MRGNCQPDPIQLWISSSLNLSYGRFECYMEENLILQHKKIKPKPKYFFWSCKRFFIFSPLCLLHQCLWSPCCCQLLVIVLSCEPESSFIYVVYIFLMNWILTANIYSIVWCFRWLINNGCQFWKVVGRVACWEMLLVLPELALCDMWKMCTDHQLCNSLSYIVVRLVPKLFECPISNSRCKGL